ncbi:6-phosphogluconolactonase [Candidatus Saccharibacteria bacterium]|nr:6-phosphogluconolactonase [Candidatus Saccharibacteria bacterium]
MGINFCKISSIEPVVAHLAITLDRHLAKDKRVLWLVTGGSSIPLAVEVASKLNRANLRNLIVTLSDERYGPIGHPDSNWQQLLDAGFNLPGAKLYPVLSGKDLEQTASDYCTIVEDALSQADFKLGFIGIGPDGHAGGIKPHSPAVNSAKLAVGYQSDDFIRLTLTPRAIARLDEVVSYALGEAKWPMLDRLAKHLPVSVLPAQCLKAVGKLTIYNDRRGDPV